jgi:small subunit ribosomal protein S15
LGTRPGEEDKWRTCYLASLLVDESALSAKSPAEVDDRYGVPMPEYRAFGIADAEQKTLFHDLPKLSSALVGQKAGATPEQITESHENQVETEKKKAALFANVIDLRNSDAGGIAYENRRRIILGFSTPENPYDPGRSEVQGKFDSAVPLLTLIMVHSSGDSNLQDPKAIRALDQV